MFILTENQFEDCVLCQEKTDLHEKLARKNDMAIDNPNVIDGMAIDKEKNAIVLLLTDHLLWDGENALSELDHLNLLQDKINAYISYLESRQYEETYPTEQFSFAIIEIHFKYSVTENCEKFLNKVQNQIGQLGIKIEAIIADR